MDISKIRRVKLRQFRDEIGGDTALSELLDRSLSQVGQIIGVNFTRNIGSNLARDIELKIDKPRDWLDTFEMESVEGNYKNYARVVGTADMGNRGYYLDLEGGDGYLEFECEKGSIAIHVRGSSMFPAIRDGWFVIIEPSNQLTIGEYVLLKFKDGKNMVKELLQTKEDCYIVMSVNGNDRITAMKQDLHGIEAISAVVPPSKHKQW